VVVAVARFLVGSLLLLLPSSRDVFSARFALFIPAALRPQLAGAQCSG
jgi:hypothetical protein